MSKNLVHFIADPKQFADRLVASFDTIDGRPFSEDDSLPLDAFETAAVVFSALPEVETARMHKIGNGFLIQDLSRDGVVLVRHALEDNGYDVSVSGDLVLARKQQKTKTTSKDKGKTKTKSNTPAKPDKLRLELLTDERLINQMRKLFKVVVQSESYASFTQFLHDVDDLLVNYKAMCAKEVPPDKGGSETSEKNTLAVSEGRNSLMASAEPSVDDLLTSGITFHDDGTVSIGLSYLHGPVEPQAVAGAAVVITKPSEEKTDA